MVCPGLETLTDMSITVLFSYPTLCDYYFYAKIMAGFFIILSFILFRIDEDRNRKGDFISSMGVSAMATIFLSVIGTSFGMIQPDVFIEILVAGIIFISIWIIKR